MIMKFEETIDLGMLLGRGRKLDGTEIVEEITTAVAERASSSIYTSASGRSRERKLTRSLGKKNLWSDEAHFYLDGAVNSQNCRIWDTSPLIMGLFGVNILLSLSSDISYLKLTPQDHKIFYVSGTRYSELQLQVIPALQEQQCFQTTIFMQDGATPSSGHEAKAMLALTIIV
ncbi:uncharacterized protein TNCV_1442621 [Trichonephila clavipes]|uniref:Uncharacterized protein n=1 Tax=Trichonephila clavipes TaxID=2585209 RepID=A0A8X6V6T2_TRICX|nr:uncharacterized protein TNCV_1442621 [Trichonephila clavipes]